MKRRTAAILVGALLTASCGGNETASNERLVVVATTTILGDVAANVVGDAGRVETLMPVGTDPHDYQPSSRQAALLLQAELVLANGLGLEEGLADILEASAADGARVFEVGPMLDPIPFEAGDPDHESEPGHEFDPHVWLDPLRMASAARLVGAELERLDPGNGFAARAEAYAQRLEAVDGEITAILADIPDERRLLITNHASFGYFAERYRFRVAGVVIPGGSTLADPSSTGLASLITTMRATGTSTVFAETTESETLAKAVASELGGDATVVPLYTGSLGEPGSGAETLVGLLLTDARLIADALR